MVMPSSVSTPFEVATHWHQCILGSAKHTPCLMNVLFSQVFVCMPRQQSFVEITQKANYPLARLQDSATYASNGTWRRANVYHARFDCLSSGTIFGERVSRCVEQLCLEISIRFPFVVATTNVLVSDATGRAPRSSLLSALAFIRFIDTSTGEDTAITYSEFF